MVDGDKALVIQDETLVAVAEREMEGIVPLFYDMAKAEATQITPDKMYESLTSAYKANIGIISNDITKIWNSGNPNINAVKWLTALNNYVIDFAKTLYLPEPPKEADLIIKSFTRNKVPHFFIYAKDKEKHQVESLNGSTVNKLYNLIPDKPIRFKQVAGIFNYKHLLNNKDVEIDDEIVRLFEKLVKVKYFSMRQGDSQYSEIRVTSEIREKMFQQFKNEELIVDTLVKYYYTKNRCNKTTLWDCFGEYIYNNLINNIGHSIQCEVCNKRVEKINESQIYCDECSREKERESWKLSKRRLRMSKF